MRPCPLVAPQTLNAVDGQLTLHIAPLRSVGNQTEEDLFLAQKIEVGVTAGMRIDDGGEVSGNIVGSMVCVPCGKRKWDFQC